MPRKSKFAPSAKSSAPKFHADVPDHLRQRFNDVVAERKKLEDELTSAQGKLRSVSREESPEEHRAHLSRVQDAKARISTISFDHAEIARAIALISGGKNYLPPPG
jgi:hypothetical protein